MTKLSRLEVAKLTNKSQSDYSNDDWKLILKNHEIEKKFENKLKNALNYLKIDTKVVNRLNYDSNMVDWSDMVVSVGGDGTFLLAASKIKDNSKPIVGFNSNPDNSEGRLCLPIKHSNDILGSLKRIQNGNFDWLLRTRIRVKFENVTNSMPKVQSLHKFSNINTQFVKETSSNNYFYPLLALNEVFVGERLSARVSFLEMTVNSFTTKMKCSGVCVTTGTGSTSWHYSINHITPKLTFDLINLINLYYNPPIDANISDEITTKFNQNLIFNPSKEVMAYTIRDLISAEVWPQPKGISPRNFVQNLLIKSHCTDGCLVIDGGISLDFNEGDKVFLEIHHEDGLKTINF